METLRKDILNVLSDEDDLLKEGSFSQYCETFFNRRSSGNTCVIFGIKKQELMTEMFGFSFPALINDSVRYLIRLKSSDKEEVQITFSDKTVGCSTEHQDKIKALYSNYNADKNINLGLYFAQKRKIPPLTLKDNWATEFMDNPNENFRVLDGAKMIEKVEIKHPKVTDVPLYRSLDDVFIIPEKNSRYAEYKKMAQQDVETPKQDSDDIVGMLGTFFGLSTEPEKKNQNSVFWRWFSENICHIDKINFMILNHNDDFVILTFINLIEQFKKRYANIDLLKRLFFVYDESAKSTKAATSKELPDNTKRLFKELYGSLRQIETKQCDCALYVCALEFLEKLDSKTKQKNEKALAKIKDYIFATTKRLLFAE
ncbi:MAG: hypothetical protein IKP73_14925 [Bacteroidales bacterium]|nr:hypothetical protein [Bacteroidales bacterium]